MDYSIKKIVAYILLVLVLFFMIIALLGIWDIINFKDVVTKLIHSLLVIFAASAVILFVFSVFIKEDEKKKVE